MEVAVAENLNPNSGCEGPEAMYVRLISADGHVFIVKKALALKYSKTILAMMSGTGELGDDEVNEVSLKEITSHILVPICNFFAYKERYSNQVGDAPDAPEFNIAKEVALELLMASNFLDC